MSESDPLCTTEHNIGNPYECGFCDFTANMMGKVAKHQEQRHRNKLERVSFKNNIEYCSFQYVVKVMKFEPNGVQKVTGNVVKVEEKMRTQPRHAYGCGNPKCLIYSLKGKIYTPPGGPSLVRIWFGHLLKCFPKNNTFIPDNHETPDFSDNAPFKIISQEKPIEAILPEDLEVHQIPASPEPESEPELTPYEKVSFQVWYDFYMI